MQKHAKVRKNGMQKHDFFFFLEWEACLMCIHTALHVCTQPCIHAPSLAHMHPALHNHVWTKIYVETKLNYIYIKNIRLRSLVERVDIILQHVSCYQFMSRCYGSNWNILLIHSGHGKRRKKENLDSEDLDWDSDTGAAAEKKNCGKQRFSCAKIRHMSPPPSARV